jgi:hypothetical protein
MEIWELGGFEVNGEVQTPDPTIVKFGVFDSSDGP